MVSTNHPKDIFKDFYHSLELEANEIHSGHGLDHDIAVAQTALLISPSVRIGLLAWVAAMLHSTDHKVRVRSVTNEEEQETAVRTRLKRSLEKLPEDFFSKDEISIITDAVLCHGEKEFFSDNKVLKVLREADMLANMSLDVVIRGGQYRPNIPSLEFSHLTFLNPLSTYNHPKSVLDAIRFTITEFPPKITLPKARQIAQKRIEDLKWYLLKIEEAYKEIGII